MNRYETSVETYLDDLARMLCDLDPGERDDVLAGIREHLDSEIATGDGGDAAVRAALLRLGPPEAVAAEARRGAEPPFHRHVLTPEPTPGSPRGGRWGRVAVITTTLATLPFLAVTVVFALAQVPAAASARPDDMGLLGPSGSEAAILMWLAWPVWVFAVVCTLAAPPLTRRTRFALALVGPVSFGVVQLTALWDAGLVGAVGSILLAVATGIAEVAVGRRAWRESSA